MCRELGAGVGKVGKIPPPGRNLNRPAGSPSLPSTSGAPLPAGGREGLWGALGGGRQLMGWTWLCFPEQKGQPLSLEVSGNLNEVWLCPSGTVLLTLWLGALCTWVKGLVKGPTSKLRSLDAGERLSRLGGLCAVFQIWKKR